MSIRKILIYNFCLISFGLSLWSITQADLLQITFSQEGNRIILNPKRILSFEALMTTKGEKGIYSPWGQGLLKIIVCPPEVPLSIKCREERKNHYIISIKKADGRPQLQVESYEKIVKENSKSGKGELFSLPLSLNDNEQEKSELLKLQKQTWEKYLNHSDQVSPLWKKIYFFMQKEKQKVKDKNKDQKKGSEGLSFILNHWKEIFAQKEPFLEFLLDYGYLDLHEDEEGDFLDNMGFDPEVFEQLEQLEQLKQLEQEQEEKIQKKKNGNSNRDLSSEQLEKIRALLRQEKTVEDFLKDLNFITPEVPITKEKEIKEFLLLVGERTKQGLPSVIKDLLKVDKYLGIKELSSKEMLTVDSKKRLVWYQKMWPTFCQKYPDLKDPFIDFILKNEQFIENESADSMAQRFQRLLGKRRSKAPISFWSMEGGDEDMNKDQNKDKGKEEVEEKRTLKQREDLIRRIKKIMPLIAYDFSYLDKGKAEENLGDGDNKEEIEKSESKGIRKKREMAKKVEMKNELDQTIMDLIVQIKEQISNQDQLLAKVHGLDLDLDFALTRHHFFSDNRMENRIDTELIKEIENALDPSKTNRCFVSDSEMDIMKFTKGPHNFQFNYNKLRATLPRKEFLELISIPLIKEGLEVCKEINDCSCPTLEGSF